MRQTAPMSEAVFGLFGALIGAAAAVGGQFVVRRRQERERWVAVLLEECARIYMIEDSFISAVWEAFGEQQSPARLRDWPRSERAMAGARLTIVCTDDELLRRAENLTETGKQLWHTAQDDSEEEWYDAMERHRRGLADFVTRASVAARNGSTI
jgi:hypothetical protein